MKNKQPFRKVLPLVIMSLRAAELPPPLHKKIVVDICNLSDNPKQLYKVIRTIKSTQNTLKKLKTLVLLEALKELAAQGHRPENYSIINDGEAVICPKRKFKTFPEIATNPISLPFVPDPFKTL